LFYVQKNVLSQREHICYSMKKEKITIERTLHSRSPRIIWNVISTADGLARWIADDVRDDGNGGLTFRWGEVWRHHEIRAAHWGERMKNDFVRWHWDDDEDEDAYIELRLNKSDVTNDYLLHITDFASPDEVEGLIGLWEDNLERLHRNTGI